MKKKIALFFLIVSIITCLLAISVSAEVITLGSFEEKSNLTYDATELVTFDDGCSYPSYYIFGDSVSFTTNYEWLNTQTGKNYKDENVVELCVPTGVTTGGYFKKDSPFKSIVKLNTGKTLTKTNGDFYQNQTLTHVTFGQGYTNGGLGTWFFNGAKVEYVVFDDNSAITTLPTQFFANLNTLKGLYLGRSITNIGSGTFSNMGSTNVFLMNTPNDTEAPEVYYFKSSLVEGNFYNFKTNSATKIWVFPSTVNGIGAGWNIDNSVNIPQNLVFLTSDADSVVVNDAIGSSKLDTKNFYFPNISSENATKMSVVPKATYYFGVDAKKSTYNGSWGVFNDISSTEHIHDTTKDENKAPTCTEAGKLISYCFCGVKIGEYNTEDALGGEHNLDLSNGAKLLSVSYSDFTKAGTKVVKCAACGTDVTTSADPILSGYKGYSTPVSSDKKGITFGYDIDINALNEYKSIDNSVEFGFVVAVDAFLGDNAPLDNTVNSASNVIKVKIDGEYGRAEFVLTGDIWDKEVEISENEKLVVSKIEFLMCAYSYSSNNGIQYIQDSVKDLKDITRITYEDACSNKAE